MLRKIKFLSILFCLTAGMLKAQNIQLVMSPNPSPYLSDWQERTETATLIISNTGTTVIAVKLKTELYDGKGTLVANTDASKMPVLTIPPGINQFNAEDIFPINAIIYKGNLASTTTKTGRIPDDNYKFCISLIDPQSGTPVGTGGTACKMFNILAFQAPVLLNPRDKETIQESGIKGIMFRWTPVSPSPKTIVTYRLQIWEVLDGQNGMTALRSNQPIIEKDLKGMLQTQWPIDFAMPEVGKSYVWTITPLDDQERKLVDGNGFAQPFGFSIITPPPIATGGNPTLISPANNSELTSLKLITFQWKGLPINTNNPVTYRLKVWQLMDGQNSTQAMRSNKPILEKDFADIYIDMKDQTMKATIDLETGPCKPPYLCDFVWNVQVINSAGIGLGDNNGLSEAFEIHWTPNGQPPPEDKSKKPVTSNHAITLLTPMNNSESKSNLSINFTWTNNKDANSSFGDDIYYTLKIVEVINEQSDVIAMQSNPAILEIKNIKEQTYATEISTLPSGKKYAWQITSGNSKSDIFTFKVTDKITNAREKIMLVSPGNNDEIDPLKAITFRWTPLVPKPKDPVTYRIKVWQLMQGQSGTQAMRSNQPIVTKDVDNITQAVISNLYTGPCRPPYLCEFIWGVQAINSAGMGLGENNGMSEPSEFRFLVVKPSSIVLQSPRNNDEIDPLKAITFRWTPLVPKPKEPVTYRIKVWQLMQGQSGSQAMRSNQPIVTKDVDNITEVTISTLYTGPCRPPYLCEFIWGVQAINSAGMGLGENNGMSEPSEFKFSVVNPSSIVLQSPRNNDEIDPLKAITFRWTPLVPKPKEPVTYRIKVWQLMSGQSGAQAMRSNQPIVTKDVDNLTEVTISNLYTGPCRPPYLCEYVWSIQAINSSGIGLGENNGLAQPFGFKFPIKTIKIQGDPIHGVDIKLGFETKSQGDPIHGVDIKLGVIARDANGDPIHGVDVKLGAISAKSASGDPVHGVDVKPGAITKSVNANGDPVHGVDVKLGVTAKAQGDPVHGVDVKLGFVGKKEDIDRIHNIEIIVTLAISNAQGDPVHGVDVKLGTKAMNASGNPVHGVDVKLGAKSLYEAEIKLGVLNNSAKDISVK